MKLKGSLSKLKSVFPLRDMNYKLKHELGSFWLYFFKHKYNTINAIVFLCFVFL